MGTLDVVRGRVIQSGGLRWGQRKEEGEVTEGGGQEAGGWSGSGLPSLGAGRRRRRSHLSGSFGTEEARQTGGR